VRYARVQRPAFYARRHIARPCAPAFRERTAACCRRDVLALLSKNAPSLPTNALSNHVRRHATNNVGRLEKGGGPQIQQGQQ